MKKIFIFLTLGIIMSISTVIAKKNNTQIIADESFSNGAAKIENTRTINELKHVIVTIPYLGMNGEKIEGQANLYYKPELLKSKNKIPVYCGVHYESSQKTIKKYCDLGFAVVTPCFDKIPIEFPLGNSYNFNIAMIQWTRRLSMVDRTKMIFGGVSGGGYMTLAMGSEFFPIAALVSDLPCVNWDYGCNYLLANQKSSGCLLPPDKPRPLPVLALIAPGANPATAMFGNDLSSDTWYTLSPISYLNRITAPVMVTAATGDMLCTIDMFTPKKFFTLDRKLFPKDYVRDFKKLTSNPKARKTLVESISEKKLATHIIPLPKKIHQFTPNDKKILDDTAYDLPDIKEIDRPWSKEKQWNFVILNEGAPLPYIGHNRYYWNTNPRSFVSHYKIQKPHVEQLNSSKFQRLLERYSGKLSDVAILANGKPANRLNYKNLEQLDVLAGLLDFARIGPEYAKRIKDLYRVSPLKPFGKTLDFKKLKKLQNEINKISVNKIYLSK